MNKRRFDSHGRLTKIGQTHCAIRGIRDALRRYAKDLRLEGNQLRHAGSSAFAQGYALGKLGLAYNAELITQAQYNHWLKRSQQLMEAQVTRPFRRPKAVGAVPSRNVPQKWRDEAAEHLAVRPDART